MFSLSFPFYSGLPALPTALYWMEEVPKLPEFLSGFEIPVLKSSSGVHSLLPLPSLTDDIDMVDTEFCLFCLFIHSSYIFLSFASLRLSSRNVTTSSVLFFFEV